MQVGTVLVPVDGRRAAERAVEHAAAVADRYDADVHALYVLPPDDARDVREGAADQPGLAAEAQSFLDDVRATCEATGVAVTCSTAMGFSAGRLTRHPGSVILDCAESVGADFVVVPREAPTDDPGMLAKAAEYVLSYASQPVLSV